ncbi:MAG: sigma-54-dependent transcriptional regulator [Candidatus Nitrospinota bacterium M3_3B_026]
MVTPNVLDTIPIVIIDDDKSICKTLKLHFDRKGYDVITTHTAYDGMRVLESLPQAITVLDVRLPDANGVELLHEIRDKGENYYSIIITAFPDMESTIKAVQNGVGEYIYKPIDIHEIENAVEKARDFFMNKGGEDKSFIPVPPLDGGGAQFVGKSQTMKELFKTVGMVSMSKTTVHITGESGTGKELVAKAIHKNSADRDEPFVSVNCSAIVETLLESELFGHVKGAFTGAIQNKEGKFSLARNGTIFLDEVGEMDINLQAKLLRVLQEREFEPVGGKEKLRANCRVISATNKELEDLVREGRFRDDLYYRLKVINIHIPPLRDRRDDIPDLALYFIAKTNKETKRDVRFISREAMDFLLSQPWKGNVRQLENVITHAVIISRGDRLTKKSFASILKPEDAELEPEQAAAKEAAGSNGSNGFRLMTLMDLEKEQIRQTLSHTKWHKGKACEILGITRPRLDRKIKKYGIKPTQVFMGESRCALN